MAGRGIGRLLQGVGGVAVGGLFVWLLLRRYEWDQLVGLAAGLQGAWVAAALLLYALSMFLRVVRWRLIMSPLREGLPLPAVAATLVMGYAVNNLLPARLGELFRADFAKRRLGLSRSGALGTIFVERTLDGVTVVTLLSVGLLLLTRRGDEGLWHIAALGALLFGLLLVGAWLAASRFGRGGARLPAALGRRIDDFRNGMAATRHPVMRAGLVLSLLVWGGEALVLWCMFLALDMPLAPAEVLVLTGVSSLSTLIPTAPGYLGTLQYAYHLALVAMGRDGAVGVVAATAVQLILYGGVVLCGGLFWLLENRRRLAAVGT